MFDVIVLAEFVLVLLFVVWLRCLRENLRVCASPFSHPVSFFIFYFYVSKVSHSPFSASILDQSEVFVEKEDFLWDSLAVVIQLVSAVVCCGGSPCNYTPFRGCTPISAGTSLPDLGSAGCGMPTEVKNVLATAASDTTNVLDFSG